MNGKWRNWTHFTFSRSAKVTFDRLADAWFDFLYAIFLFFVHFFKRMLFLLVKLHSRNLSFIFQYMKKIFSFQNFLFPSILRFYHFNFRLIEIYLIKFKQIMYIENQKGNTRRYRTTTINKSRNSSIEKVKKAQWHDNFFCQHWCMNVWSKICQTRDTVTSQRLTFWISCQDPSRISQDSSLEYLGLQPGSCKIMEDYPGNPRVKNAQKNKNFRTLVWTTHMLYRRLLLHHSAISVLLSAIPKCLKWQHLNVVLAIAIDVA